MFINFWQPALASHELPAGAERRVRMLGLHFRLRRGVDGAVSCLPDLGPHTPPAGYPVAERYGIVFAFLGDLPESERVPIMPIPEYQDAAWRANLMVFDGACNYQRSVENALDPAHTEFVHPTMGFGGEKSDYRVPDFVLERRDHGGFFMLDFLVAGEAGNRPPGAGDRGFSSRAGSGWHGPAQFYTYIEALPYVRMYQYMYELPVDEGHIRIFLVNTRSTMRETSSDAQVIRSCESVVRQDLAVLEKVRPLLTPDSGREFLVPADKALLAYRADLDDYRRRGWALDTERLARESGPVAIPGTGARVPPVPLLT
jgi:phenylpropionate dioxygenase-like ring-hydroxylating dioxygenase large terminal subunit